MSTAIPISQIVQGTLGSTIHSIAGVHRMGTEVRLTASAAQPAEIRCRIGRQTPGATRVNEEIGSKVELVIGWTAIGRSRPQVATAWILEAASRVESATELPAIVTPVTVRVLETRAQIEEEAAEIESGIAAFPTAAALEIPVPLAEAVAPVEGAHAAAALAVHPVWVAARVADQGAAAGDAVDDSLS
jgi:hypothetical protein